MADTTSSSESLALALLTNIVQLILAILRLAALILENSARILDLSMQHVTSTTFPGNKKAGTQRSVTPEASQSENVYSGATPPSPELSPFTVADPESPVATGHETSCQHTLFRPLPLFCDPKTKTRRFYCVTIGRQVGVFDNR